ncbi:amylovoran biosynthesis protein [Serratia phage vB_SmaS-Totoro]|nr:amylovoran biosynthesis protein [Serratia phage vB_SmaS-Totoro]
MDNGQKISQLPKSSTPQERDYFPFNTANQGSIVETSVLTLNDLRLQMDYRTAFASLEDGVNSTQVGDKFFVYENASKFFVVEYTRNDAGAVPTLNEQQAIKRLMTREGLQYAKTHRTLPSISSLRSTKPTYDNEVVSVDSYRTGKGIGGGKFAFIKSDKTSVDDGGAVIVGNDGSRWKRVFDDAGTINPIYWGAVPNDDTIDSAPAFTNMSKWSEGVPVVDATTRAALGNVKMVTAPGRYYIKTPITLQCKSIDYDFSGSILDCQQLTPGTASAPNIAIKWMNMRGYPMGTMSCLNLRAYGPGLDKFVDFMHMDDATAYYWANNSMSFINGGCDRFGTGFTYSSNTYYVKFYNFQFNYNDICYTNNAAMTNAGEQVHFVSCFFTQSNVMINMNRGHTVFDNCSFDYAYKTYVKIDSGSPNLRFNDGWFEGEGPYTNAFIFGDTASANAKFSGTNFIFRGANTKASANVFYVGDSNRVELDGCYLTNMGVESDNAAVTGLVSGTGIFRIKDTKFFNNIPNMSNIIQPDNPLENYIRPTLFSDSTFWAHELWIPEPGGTGCEIRKSRLGWGTSTSTNFSLQKLNGYIQIGSNTVPKGGNYKLCIGSLPLVGNGPVVFKIKCGTYAASPGRWRFQIVYCDATFFGADQDKSPIIHKEALGPYYDLQTRGNGTAFQEYYGPTQIPGFSGQSKFFATPPPWATHAYLMIDVTNLAMNMAHRITDIYMRQI